MCEINDLCLWCSWIIIVEINTEEKREMQLKFGKRIMCSNIKYSIYDRKNTTS